MSGGISPKDLDEASGKNQRNEKEVDKPKKVHDDKTLLQVNQKPQQ